MKIQKAILSATSQGRGIARKSWGTRSRILLPTNTSAGFIRVPFKREGTILREWRPQMKDILATDWIVLG
ncbi:hypothetical protein C1940_08910 [Lactiplantibacillus plantarum subsp. plantarum]|uniref:Thoeris anti-defense Tad2 family protein n=1 Tax=Lactiplantibacillus plantarum TaxID=1590 RepID=UPI000CD357A4|nr:MW1434 family type I TA system toxin [Lactiplantibacillus plantarum]AUV72578.1 hypothetical protein C1940_08910 [Lactiplantibacillus plantarum subsp. plantarum]